MTKEDKNINYHIKNRSPVEIIYNNDTGEWFYSVQVQNTEIWLNSFKTEQDAFNFCKLNNLLIVKHLSTNNK